MHFFVCDWVLKNFVWYFRCNRRVARITNQIHHWNRLQWIDNIASKLTIFFARIYIYISYYHIYNVYIIYKCNIYVYNIDIIYKHIYIYIYIYIYIIYSSFQEEIFKISGYRCYPWHEIFWVMSNEKVISSKLTADEDWEMRMLLVQKSL